MVHPEALVLLVTEKADVVFAAPERETEPEMEMEMEMVNVKWLE